ncbi:hypothetical protein LC608_25440 [Nostoc sp. XA010]|uniref:hypothetical protein n=1 Tax=Nostoc sp. XA010 TaxID=2780407 RepID=UPI001E49B980|nr:hypothetical protein [Nostoc sp. XA010]MCC5660260.1 hypothetical protein [Nostoc sp. XA010]
MNEEASKKLELIRQILGETQVQGVRLRGTDWFAWATGGVSTKQLDFFYPLLFENIIC